MLLAGSRGRFGCSVRDHNSSNRSSAHPLSQLQCNACFLRVKIYGTTLFKVSLWRDEMQMLTSRFPVFSFFATLSEAQRSCLVPYLPSSPLLNSPHKEGMTKLGSTAVWRWHKSRLNGHNFRFHLDLTNTVPRKRRAEMEWTGFGGSTPPQLQEGENTAQFRTIQMW